MDSWLFTFDWVAHYFSISLLIKTLFAPWKRLVEVDDSPGFNPQKILETLMFNLISRGIGATVRLALLFAGMILMIVTFFAGISGLILWLIFPVVGFLVYNKHQSTLDKFTENLLFLVKSSKEPPVSVIFNNEAGMFVLAHAGLEIQDLVSSANNEKIKLENLKAQSYTEVLEYLTKNKVWTDDFFRKRGIKSEDLVLAAQWWDKDKRVKTQMGSKDFGRPGLGLELLFGYTPTLNKYSIDLSSPRSYSHHLIGREEVVSRMERVLTAGNSVVLIGQPGVGKRTVVLEFAHRASAGNLGAALTYRRVLEFDYNSLLSEAKDLNAKKKELSLALKEAAYAGNIILMFRDIHRLTNPEVEGYDFTDIFEENIEDKDLKIIAVTTPTEFERFIVPNMRLRKFLADVKVTPPTKEQAMEILVAAAQDWEQKNKITILIPALRKILEESDRYITETPFPEKALELLDAVVMYVEQQKKNIITSQDADFVLAEKTGVSFARLTETEKTKLTNLEGIIHKRLIDQETAVNLIAKSLRSKTVGVAKEKRPIGSFLFLGPTGVGKTETAKVLARVYYGSEENILRFDMAEYAGSEGLERLVGSAQKNLPGALTTAIKNKPASLLLLDEFEKASPEIYNLFLALLDEGEMTDAFGKKIMGRHLFVIATSNAAAEYIRQLVNQGVSGDELQKKVVEHVLEKGLFTPEFLNRFDGVVVYEPLRSEDLVKIAAILLKELGRNLKQKGIILEVTDETAVKLAQDGYEPAFGARPMKRIINLVLGDMLGKAILAGELKEGDKIRMLPGQGKEEYGWEKLA